MVEKVFVTGASGYIGGSVAALLVKNGFEVTGLTRSAEKAAELEAYGIKPAIGNLDDASFLTECAVAADIIVDAADSDSEDAVKTFIRALAGSDKTFIHTSGSSIVSDQANGEPSNRIFEEHTLYTPDPLKQARVDIDSLVIKSAEENIRGVVICPCMIYGEGLGPKKESQQVPTLINQAIKSGTARCIGRGQNTWSTIHIEDLANMYLTVIRTAPKGGLFLFAESGEVVFKELVEKIRESLSIKSPVEEWPIENAIEEWGPGAAIFALGSNSRIRSEGAKKMGWKPVRESVLDDVPRCCSHLSAVV